MPLCVLSLFSCGTSGLVASADNDNLGWFKDWLCMLWGRHNLGMVVCGFCNQITCFCFPKLAFLSNSMWQTSVCPEESGLQVNSHFFPEVPEKCFSFCCLSLKSHTHPRVIHTGWEEAKAGRAWSGTGARDGVYVPGGMQPQSRKKKESQGTEGWMGTQELKQQMPKIAQGTCWEDSHL